MPVERGSVQLYLLNDERGDSSLEEKRTFVHAKLAQERGN